jgi:hypothetical protein
MRLLIILLIFSTPIFSQTNYPKEDFSAPLDIPMQLSGNFGELRPNHFHAGLDFKTQQKEGWAVYAVGEVTFHASGFHHLGTAKPFTLTIPTDTLRFTAICKKDTARLKPTSKPNNTDKNPLKSTFSRNRRAWL